MSFENDTLMSKDIIVKSYRFSQKIMRICQLFHNLLDSNKFE
ncbi:MAG: hypothetical protein PF505_01035 [Vallitaleaceae bacterium]|nr:hypothetical protein [Vallitaleaceae bacterium]